MFFILLSMAVLGPSTVAGRIRLDDVSLAKLYDANAEECDYFVAGQVPGGSNNEDGSEWRYPFETLECAIDYNCNNGLSDGSVVCLLGGVYEIYDTVRPKKSITIRALGQPHSVVFDGLGQTRLVSTGRQDVTFKGIHFTNGIASSGAAVYGERSIIFHDCIFSDNEGKTDGAVMVTRHGEFYNCHFEDNTAKYAAGARISDIGQAVFENCTFVSNIAESKGGAIVTQIEKPKEKFVELTNCLFCFNEAPISPHIYNFRDNTHECVDDSCSFNSPECCHSRGRVVRNEKYDSDPDNEPQRMCECRPPYHGKRCELSHDEL